MIEISDKFYDKTFKLFRYKNFENLCSNCGIFIEFDGFNDKELVDDGGTTYIMDISINDKRGYSVIIEFQSSVVDEADIERFMKYATLTYIQYKKPVEIYVLSTVEEKNRVIRRRWNFFNEFTIYVKSLKSIDGDKVLNSLKKKSRFDDDFTGDDIVDLLTIIFMKSVKTTVELLKEICLLVNEINALDEKELYDIKTFLLMYVKKFVEDKQEARILEELIGMRNDLYGRTWASVRNRAFLEGEARLVRNMLDNGYDLDTISKITSLDKEYISNLIE